MQLSIRSQSNDQLRIRNNSHEKNHFHILDILSTIYRTVFEEEKPAETHKHLNKNIHPAAQGNHTSYVLESNRENGIK